MIESLKKRIVTRVSLALSLTALLAQNIIYSWAAPPHHLRIGFRKTLLQ